MARYERAGVRRYFQADVAFAKTEMYEYPESGDTGYAMRLLAIDVLQRNILHLLKRSVGRPTPVMARGVNPRSRNQSQWALV